MKKKSKVVSFLLSFLPGAGQIYLGQKVRGLVFLTLLITSIAVMLLSFTIAVNYRYYAGMENIFSVVFLIAFFAMIILSLVSLIDNMITRDRVLKCNYEERDKEIHLGSPAIENMRVQFLNRRIKAMLLSIVPGAGHMYMGLLTQGIQLMSIFLFCFYLNALLKDSIFIFAVPVIWFFSMFDTMKKVSMEANPEDDDILFIKWVRKGKAGQQRKYRALGYILLLIGIVAVMNRIAAPVVSRMLQNGEMREYIQTGVLATIFIVGGVKLVLGGRKEVSEEESGQETAVE